MEVKEIKSLESIVPFEYYIKHLLTFLKYLRIWQETNTFSALKLFLLNITVAVFLFSNIVLVISEILMVSFKSDIETLSNTISPLGLHITGIIKWTYCTSKNKEIRRLIDDLNQCYLLSRKIEIGKRECVFSKSEMESVCKESKKWQYFWTTLCVCGVLNWCFIAFLLNFTDQETNFNTKNSNVTLPYITKQPWNVETVMGYTLSYIIHLFGALSSTISCACYDSLYICILIVIGGQLRCLSLSLIDTNSIVDERTVKELEMKLRNCVDHHAAVLKISESLETFGFLPMFIQCLENIIIVCLLSFEISIIEFNSESITKLVSIMIYFIALSVQFYGFCFYSTRVYTLSLQINDAVYACEWEQIIYDHNIGNTEEKKELLRKVKHLVLLLSLRSQKPIIMTGGPFYVLSLETYKAIMTLAVSNAVILRQFNDSDI